MQQPQAIRPDSFSDYRKIIERGKPKSDIPEVEDERFLAAMSTSEGWKVLLKYIKELESDLNNINKSMMERGASFDEIGRNAVIVQLATELLTKIVQKVDDAQESANRSKR